MWPWSKKSNARDVAPTEIDLGSYKYSPGYIPVENTKLLLDLAQTSLQSQIEGVRQMLSRVGAILSQAVGLTTAAIGADYWVFTHKLEFYEVFIRAFVVFLTLSWVISGVLAMVGMIGAKFAAPGIHPEDGYTQDVLGQDIRAMHLWVVDIVVRTINAGRSESDKLKSYLNASIFFIVAAPTLALLLALLFCLI